MTITIGGLQNSRDLGGRLDERGGSAAYLQSGGVADAELDALRIRPAG